VARLAVQSQRSFRNVFVAAAGEFGNRSQQLTPMTKGRSQVLSGLDL
jgi:hypothetical protein